MSDIIDFEQSEDGMMVAYGVCDQLDELKHTYHGLPDFLTKVNQSPVLCCHRPVELCTGSENLLESMRVKYFLCCLLRLLQQSLWKVQKYCLSVSLMRAGSSHKSGVVCRSRRIADYA